MTTDNPKFKILPDLETLFEDNDAADNCALRTFGFRLKDFIAGEDLEYVHLHDGVYAGKDTIQFHIDVSH